MEKCGGKKVRPSVHVLYECVYGVIGNKLT